MKNKCNWVNALTFRYYMFR